MRHPCNIWDTQLSGFLGLGHQEPDHGCQGPELGFDGLGPGCQWLRHRSRVTEHKHRGIGALRDLGLSLVTWAWELGTQAWPSRARARALESRTSPPRTLEWAPRSPNLCGPSLQHWRLGLRRWVPGHRCQGSEHGAPRLGLGHKGGTWPQPQWIQARASVTRAWEPSIQVLAGKDPGTGAGCLHYYRKTVWLCHLGFLEWQPVNTKPPPLMISSLMFYNEK